MKLKVYSQIVFGNINSKKEGNLTGIIIVTIFLITPHNLSRLQR